MEVAAVGEGMDLGRGEGGAVVVELGQRDDGVILAVEEGEGATLLDESGQGVREDEIAEGFTGRVGKGRSDEDGTADGDREALLGEVLGQENPPE